MAHVYSLHYAFGCQRFFCGPVILSPSNTPELRIGYISSEGIAKCFIVLLLPTLEKFIIEFESAPPLRGRILLPQATVTQYFQISFLFKGILVAQFGCLQRTNRTRTRSFDFRVAQSCHKLSNLIDHSVGPKLTPFRHEEIRFFLKLGCLLRVSSHKTWLFFFFFFFFFLYPFPCALGYRTLCSTSLCCTLSYPRSSPLSDSLPFLLSSHHLLSEVTLRNVNCRWF